MNHIVMQSNLYSVQIDPEKPLELTVDELERFLGVVFFMSIISLPSSRLYWSLDLAITQILPPPVLPFFGYDCSDLLASLQKRL